MEEEQASDEPMSGQSFDDMNKTCTIIFDIIDDPKHTIYEFRLTLALIKERYNNEVGAISKNSLNILQFCIIKGRWEFFTALVEIGWWEVLSDYVVPDTGSKSYRGKTAKEITEMDIHRSNLENFCYAQEWENNLSPLMKACRSADIDEAKKLVLIESDDRFALDQNGGNALFWAVINGRSELLEIMISKGLDPTILNNNNENLLHVACRVGQAKLLPTLLKPCYKLDPTHRDQYQNTPIDRGAINGNIEVFKELVKHGIHPQPYHMFMCIDNGRLPLLSYLVETLQMSVDVTDEKGVSLLLRASMENRTSIVKYLIENKASTLCMVKDTSRNLLHIICETGDAELLKAVIPMLKEQETLKILINETDFYMPEDSVFLVHEGENNWVCKEVSRTDVPALLAKIDTNMVDGVHFPCVDRSISNDGNVMKLIDETDEEIKNRCLNNEQVTDKTPMHIAALKGYTEVAQTLIMSGCDVNIKDCFGNTPAILAASCGDLELLESLEKAGADMKVKNKQDKSIEDVAKENGHVNIVKFAIGRDFLELTKAFTDHNIAELRNRLSKVILDANEHEGTSESRKTHILQSLKDFDNGINILLGNLGVTDVSDEQMNKDITVECQATTPVPITVVSCQQALSEEGDIY